METKKPNIAIIYNENFSQDLFDDFARNFENSGLSILIESKSDDGPYACMEWFIPSAIGIFFASSYFGGIFSEMGKDHYLLLKNKLGNLTKEVMSKPKIEPLVFGTRGKVNKNNPYSLALSIQAQANDGSSFKLLLPKPSNEVDYTKIVYTFLDFLNDYHHGILHMEDIGYDSNLAIRGTILVHMNLETKRIEWLDHRPQQQ